MTEHLTLAQLSALADGELAGDDLNFVKQHIDECLPCARSAVDQWLLKDAVAKAGKRYEAPADFVNRVTGVVARNGAIPAKDQSGENRASAIDATNWSAVSGWAVAALLMLMLGTWGIVRYRSQNVSGGERAALVSEACDLHIAMLAANQPPQVISSDRHTVKPWFQGKLPFSFNLPETLPADTTLDGANLAYLHNHPVAQLLFSIGRHHVSVFVEEKSGGSAPAAVKTTHEGFNVTGFATEDLEVIAVSDVDPARLSALSSALQTAQIHR